MIAAIYARKSTDQSAVADEAKSVRRQIDHARGYATRKGWTVDEAHVYVDDGISGAEFSNRPGFVRLMATLKPLAPFGALIMSEESRLGREAIETAYALKQLIAAGVRVFFYLEDRERTLDSPTDKIMLSLTAFADELEREKARQRTYDAMVRKAQNGYVTGGRLFGYDNLRDEAGVRRMVNEREAAIVRRIFEMCVAGDGFTRIAKTLNSDRVPCPRPQQGRPAGWSPSTVREVLNRDSYRGVVVWNRTRKRDRWGQHRQASRPNSEWLQRSVPELRIVSDDVWTAAHARLRTIRASLVKAAGGRMLGRRRDVESNYLLPGFARCGVCGGGLCVMSRDSGHRRLYVYGCLANHKRGHTVCENALVRPMDDVDQAVLGKLANEVLRTAVVDAVMQGVLEALEPRTRARQAETYRAELASVERELARLAEAIATTGAVSALMTAITDRQAKRDELVAAIAAADMRHVDRHAIEQKVRAKLEGWRGLLTRNVQDGRQLLREVLVGPMRFTPEDGHFRFLGYAAMDRLLSGTTCNLGSVPTGIRTRVSALKGPRPRPLDDGDVDRAGNRSPDRSL